jgi:hypothetical protein
MGHQFDSGITRVRPFFQPLLRRDPGGLSWLPPLLRLSWANPDLAEELTDDFEPLLDWVAAKRPRSDRALRLHGIPSVELEQCFEHRLPPPQLFLRWLIDNPSRMCWPAETEMSQRTQLLREELFGRHGLERQQFAQKLAREELRSAGSIGSNGKWWAFEGFTRVDCFLETPRFILLIEGKRVEPFSPSTLWFPSRNQVLRNLDVAREVAREKNKNYAVLVMAEDHIDPMTIDGIDQSLPHLPERQCSQMLSHYLGCVTWSQALARLSFPHTVEEAARMIKAGGM